MSHIKVGPTMKSMILHPMCLAFLLGCLAISPSHAVTAIEADGRIAAQAPVPRGLEHEALNHTVEAPVAEMVSVPLPSPMLLLITACLGLVIAAGRDA